MTTGEIGLSVCYVISLILNMAFAYSCVRWRVICGMWEEAFKQSIQIGRQVVQERDYWKQKYEHAVGISEPEEEEEE